MVKMADIRIQCGFCGKWITKSNMARHKKKHGELVCQRCALKIGEVQRCIDKSHALWFTAFQNDLVADEVTEKMRLNFNASCDDTDKELFSQYLATLLDLQYYHISMDYFTFHHIFSLVLNRIKP